MKNNNLKTAEIVREHIEHLLPNTDFIDSDKLNINLKYLCDVSKDISTDVPLSMRMIFGIYNMANFVSQFQWKINLGGTKVPTNVIGFLLSASGNGKDSTVNAQRKALDPGYLIIEQKREEDAKARARAAAETKDGEPSNWQQHYRPPLPLENSISTVEGLVSRLNVFAQNGLGMSSIYSGEVGSELQTNPNIVDNIRLLSELFDTGDRKSKAIKDSERQDQPVHGMGICSLFVGSENNIILDRQVSAKFKTEFVTKLARRSIFVYPTQQEFDAACVSYNSYEDMIEKQDTFERAASEAKAFIGSASMDIASNLVESENRLLDIDEDALRAYKDYKMYTTALGNGIDFIYQSVQLEQMHRSWKMLKLAGVFALWDNRDYICMQDIEESIYIVELLGKYLEIYEQYAAKESYELLLDYFKSNPDRALSLHDLKKRGFITGNTSIDTRVKELVKLSDSLAAGDGIVKFEGDMMSFKPFESVGEHHASYVECVGTKAERALKCHTGFIYKQTNFAKLKVLLENDVAYTPFNFTDGNRKNDNIISGATWVALDVDDSDITINEMHDILDGINHHIGTTSDSSNPYKFRVILEFNKIVDLPVREWKQFGKAIGKELGIEIDPVTFTKSQIMFGYKGANVLSCTDEDPFDVSECIKEATKTVMKKDTKPTITQARKLLDNPLTTFSYAFTDDVKARSLTLYRLWRHIMDLGGREEEAEKIMRELNYEFWSSPISDERFDSYVTQMKKAYEERRLR